MPDILPPGEYALQVVVTDRLGKDKDRSAADQWIGFEVDGAATRIGALR